MIGGIIHVGKMSYIIGVAGTYPVPKGVRDDLLRLCAERVALLEEVARRLKAA